MKYQNKHFCANLKSAHQSLDRSDGPGTTNRRWPIRDSDDDVRMQQLVALIQHTEVFKHDYFYCVEMAFMWNNVENI